MAFHFTDLVFKVTNWTDTRFTHIEKAVLNALATRADEQGKCFPGFTCLVSDTGVSRGRLSDAIANIKELGLVEVEVGHRGKFRYALNESAISTFGGLDGEDELADESKPKVKTIRGKNGHTYTKVAPKPAELLCDLCGNPFLECVCDREPEATPPPSEDFNEMTCPKCEVTGLMTQHAYDNHVSICTGKVKTAPPPPEINKPTPVPVKPASVQVPPPPPPVVVVPKVNCPMPHCSAFGTEEQVNAHMTTLNHVCKECKTAYHTKLELTACEDKHLDEYKASRKAKEEERWASLTPSQRRAEWEKDKQNGMRNDWSVCGRWRKGEKFND